MGNAHVSQFETKFEVVTEDKIFQIQDETRKSIEGLVHVLTCKSDKSPHYKKKIMSMQIIK